MKARTPETPLPAGGPGVSRRAVLRTGALAFLGLSVAEAAPALASSPTPGEDAGSRILILLSGGPSHLDTFDPKPDAPAEVRGPFGAVSGRGADFQLCEHLPRLAAMGSRFSVLRGLAAADGDHDRASRALLASVVDGHLSHPVVGRAPRGASGRACVLSEALLAEVIAAEPARIAESYGSHSLGRACLVARSLVERGARLVVVTDAGWDTHGNAFAALRDRLLPRLDGALSALLADLHDRGMLAGTQVLCAGEFGRTPRINAFGGRDHWPAVGAALLAGRGAAAGSVLGATDRTASAPVEDGRVLTHFGTNWPLLV